MSVTREAESIAARLGGEILCDLGPGDDGEVYLLEDRRALKLTGSMLEASIADALASHGKPHSAFPAIESVHWFTSSIDIAGTKREFTRYAILREEIPEVLEDPEPDQVELWSAAVRMLGQGWYQNDFKAIQDAIELWPGRGLLPVYSGLLWAKIYLGVDVRDIRPSNLGKRADGSIVIRDFGRADVPEAVMAKVRALSIPEVPEEPALAPAI